VVRSFCFGLNIFSPLVLIAKNEDVQSPIYIFSPPPIGKGNMSEGLYQFESVEEQRQRINDTVRDGVCRGP
jgi:hypothetical protein